MPELPEAQTIAAQLDRELSGARFADVHLTRTDIVHGDPRPLDVILPGRKVQRVWRRAKRIIIELRPRAELVFRLGMSGRLILCDSAEPIEKHTHLRITLRDRPQELRFFDPRRFGGIWCLAGSREHVGKRLGEVGPEPLDLTPAAFASLLDRPRQIKALLMDQRAIAGLGNIYCDESLYAAGVHPLTQADRLSRDHARRLLGAIKRILRRAIRANGSTLRDYRRSDGRKGSFQNMLRVYQRAGEPCPACLTPIQRITAAGRSTFLCPACQRLV